MTFGNKARTAGRAIKALGLTLALLAAPAMAAPAPAAPAEAAAATATDAAAAAPAAVAPAAAAAPAAPAAPAVDPNDPRFQVAPGKYVPMKPTAGKGMPTAGGYTFQDQYTETGKQALHMHQAFLLPVVFATSLLVLFLLIFVMARFNRRANPVPSKTAHNTMLEVAWTGIPVLILVAISVPSVKLINKQFAPPPESAVTIKATGNQWYWTYKYPDNGDIEVISNMLPDDKAIANGEPAQLAVDNRLVVPVGEPIRMQITAADVIHAFAVPSLWFKIDAVPGKLSEKQLIITEPGVYYGQCSELCGARHGYMPITIEALPRDQFNRWVLEQGGKIDGLPDAPAAAAPVAGAAAPAAKPAA
jgi:cytochrome c oxidase subunit II